MDENYSENSDGRGARRRPTMSKVKEERALLLKHIADLRNQRNKSLQAADSSQSSAAAQKIEKPLKKEENAKSIRSQEKDRVRSNEANAYRKEEAQKSSESQGKDKFRSNEAHFHRKQQARESFDSQEKDNVRSNEEHLHREDEALKSSDSQERDKVRSNESHLHRKEQAQKHIRSQEKHKVGGDSVSYNEAHSCSRKEAKAEKDSFWPSSDQNDACLFESSRDSDDIKTCSSVEISSKLIADFQNQAISSSRTPDFKDDKKTCSLLESTFKPPTGLQDQASSSSQTPDSKDNSKTCSSLESSSKPTAGLQNQASILSRTVDHKDDSEISHKSSSKSTGGLQNQAGILSQTPVSGISSRTPDSKACPTSSSVFQSCSSFEESPTKRCEDSITVRELNGMDKEASSYHINSFKNCIQMIDLSSSSESSGISDGLSPAVNVISITPCSATTLDSDGKIQNLNYDKNAATCRPSSSDFQNCSLFKESSSKVCDYSPIVREFNWMDKEASSYHANSFKDHVQMIDISSSSKSLGIPHRFSPAVNMTSIIPRDDTSGSFSKPTRKLIEHSATLGRQNTESLIDKLGNLSINCLPSKENRGNDNYESSSCFTDELDDLGKGELAVAEMGFSDEKQVFRLSSKLATILYPHQREGIKWLWGLHIKCMGGILGDDMGLGKTMQVAAFLSGLFSLRLIRRAMIVAPKTLIAHWMKEFSVVGLQDKIRDYSGSSGNARDFSLYHVLQVGGILVTTYDLVRHNWKALKGDYHGGDDFPDPSNDLVTWDYLVLDEGHLLKNPSTQRAKSLREIPSTHRIIISGTPIQNNLREMWALYDFCCPGLLGDRKEFKYKYEDLIVRGNDKHATDRQKRIGSAVAQDLRQRIAPFLLRRLKGEVFPDTDKSDRKLANKNDIIVWLRLSKEQRQLYTAFLNSETVHRSFDGSALAALTVLKKICDHPCLLTKRAADDIVEGMESTLDREEAAVAEAMTASLARILQAPEKSDLLQGEKSCKVKFLMALLETLVKEQHRTLIFAQTLKMLNIIQEKIILKGYSWCRIDGTMKASDREKNVQEFQKDNRISIFLLTSQVGGLGLTLTGADRVVIIDPAWNPSNDNQSVDRAYRIGQLKDVIVYRLMTCGTIEEKIYRKQVFKGGLMKVATEQKEQFRYFSQQELRELLTVPETGFDISVTQQQLYSEHASQCNIDEKLQQHIKFLESQDIAGVSYHDLLFSKEAPKLPPAESDEEPPAAEVRILPTQRASTQQLPKFSQERIERFTAPQKLGKGFGLQETGMNSLADTEARKANEHVLQLQEMINRLSRTLADDNMISRLPDGGENIRNKLHALKVEHIQATLHATSLKENRVRVTSTQNHQSEQLHTFS